MAEKKIIQSIQRAFDIIDCFDSKNSELSLKNICDKVDLKKSTVFGIIKSLEECSYIVQNHNNNKYKLGLKFVEKGRIVSESLDIKNITLPYMKKLTDTFKETSHLCLYEENNIYCVANMLSDEAYLFVSSKVGNILPIHASASGKIILASFPDEKVNKILEQTELKKLTKHTITDIAEIKDTIKYIRENSYSIEDEEAEIGAYSIAVGIKNFSNATVGAVSVTGPKSRMEDKKEEIITTLMDASLAISKELGYDYSKNET